MRFFLALLFVISSNVAFAIPSIIGGTPVTSSDVPWVVKIEKDKKQHCSGSIISSKWILTAGHCFYDTNSSYTILGGGNGKREKLIQLPAIKRIIVHPKFYSSIMSPATDIALVELMKDISLDKTLDIIPILDSEDFESIREFEEVSIYGWGDVGKNQEVPSELSGITLPLVPAGDYPKLKGLLFFKRFVAWLDPARYLITMKKDVSTCGGDSGTGWTMNFQGRPYLVAVHNAGDDCESISVGNILGNHMKWIQSLVK